MCTNPHTIADGTKIACRKCNECIATRKNDWVARAMAEKAAMKNALVLTLTHRDNANGTKPVNATAFRYADVQKFIKRIRAQYQATYNATAEISYIVAGEVGSKGTKRVHWHIILFSKQDLSVLGKWADKKGKAQPSMKLEERQHWTLWKYGLVFPQIPDQGGMAYVIKYALKDMFNVENSKGTMRFSKAENHGASYFRMSKAPPIGHRWLDEKIKSWAERKVLPTSLALKVPEYSGYWWPRGKVREKLALALREINEARKKETGKDCPQYETLLQSILSEEKIYEAFIYGTETEQENGEFNISQFATEMADRSIEATRKIDHGRIVARCGGGLPCRQCWRAKTQEQRRDYRAEYEYEKGKYLVWLQTNSERPSPTYREWLDRKVRASGGPNPHCQGNGEYFVEKVFDLERKKRQIRRDSEELQKKTRQQRSKGR